MKKISSRFTFYYKRVFPVIWFGFIGLFFFSLLSQFGTKPMPLPALLMPIVMVFFGYFIMRRLVFDLVDEVFDCGDYLLVKSGSKEDKVYLKDIRNVGYSNFTNPSRVTLSLRKSSLFGNEVSFSPIWPWKPFRFFKSPIIEDLIIRIDSARNLP